MSEWYQEVDKDLSVSLLEQGDILKNIPLLGFEMLDSRFGPEVGLEPTITELKSSAIVLTQTCDLVNGYEKMPHNILLALVNDVDNLIAENHKIVTSGSAADKELESNRHPRLMLLPPFGEKFNWHVVDFSDLHTLHKSFYAKNFIQPELHLRLTSPARENLSQMFARHIMRVALNTELFGYADMIKKKNKEKREKAISYPLGF